MNTISKHILTALCALLLLPIAQAAEPLSDKESVFIYCDSAYSSAFKDMKSQFKDTLSTKKISWKIKAAKKTDFISLAENIEKELLKSKADRIIIALGSEEFWDKRKKKPTHINAEEIKTAIAKIIDTVQASEKSIILCTPHQILAGKSEAANSALSAASKVIQSTAESKNVTCCDFYSAFAQKNSSGDPGKRMKGITTKDGIKLNDIGGSLVISSISQVLALSETAMSRDLQESDIILLAGPFPADILEEFSLKLKAHYKETMAFLSPRAVHASMSVDFFAPKLYSIDKIKINKPTIMFIYPGSRIVSNVKTATLDDGVFKAKLKEHLEYFKAELPQTSIFVCTPLIWRESDASNLVVVGGVNFKICEKWAQQIKEVADETGIPVLDVHKNCMDYINSNGVENAHFAGRGSKATYFTDSELLGHEIIRKSIAQAINFDAYNKE